MKTVSIITPVYNHEKFIRDTISSVLNQTYQDWEMLIVDDCSTDNSWKIIQEYAEKDKRIRAFRNEKNKGLISNWKFLIDNSRGEHVAFLEGDDVFNEKNLEEKMKIFEQYPEVGMVYCNFEVIGESNESIINNFYKKLKIKTYINQKIAEEEYLYSNYLFSTYSQIMIKKSVLSISGYPRSLDLNEKVFLPSDWDFNFRISTKNKIYFLDDILLRYRKHSKNSSANTSNVSRQLLMVLNDYEKEFKNNAKVLKAIGYMKGKACYFNAVFYAENGMKKEAWKTFFFYIKKYPKNFFRDFLLNVFLIVRLFLPSRAGLYLKNFYFSR